MSRDLNQHPPRWGLQAHMQSLAFKLGKRFSRHTREQKLLHARSSPLWVSWASCSRKRHRKRRLAPSKGHFCLILATGVPRLKDGVVTLKSFSLHSETQKKKTASGYFIKMFPGSQKKKSLPFPDLIPDSFAPTPSPRLSNSLVYLNVLLSENRTERFPAPSPGKAV